MQEALVGKFTAWTVTLVVILGLANTVLLLQPPPSVDASLQSSPVPIFMSQLPSGPPNANSRQNVSDRRAPASLGASAVAAHGPTNDVEARSLGGAKLAQAVDIELSCTSEVRAWQFTDHVEQIRLMGQDCPSEKPARSKKSKLSIVNLANGFTATVFDAGGFGRQRFTTDYISLENGRNKLQLKREWDDGHTSTEELVLDRAPAAIQSGAPQNTYTAPIK